MQPVLSTHIFSKQRLEAKHFDVLHAAGAEAVEIWDAVQHFDHNSRPAVRDVAQYFAGSALKLHSMHYPMYREKNGERQRNNVVHRERAERIAAMDEVKRCIEVAEQAPFRFLVLHLDEWQEPWSEAVLDHSLTAVEHLRAFARPLGVTIALENLFGGIAEPENLLQVLNTGHFDDAGLCFDSGHAHIVAATRAREKSTQHAADGSVQVAREAVIAEYTAMLDLMTHRIVTTHLHDNDSTRDAHLWPLDESLEVSATESAGLPWHETMASLRTAAHKPAANLEIHSTLGGDASCVESRAKTCFRQLQIS